MLILHRVESCNVGRFYKNVCYKIIQKHHIIFNKHAQRKKDEQLNI